MPKERNGSKLDLKLIDIVRRLRRSQWYWIEGMSYENQKTIKEFNLIKEVKEGFNLSEIDTLNVIEVLGQAITLGEVLEYIRKKFHLKHISPHITQTVAVWRFKHDNLFHQYNYCIDWIHYLVMVKKPNYDKRNTNQKDGVE